MTHTLTVSPANWDELGMTHLVGYVTATRSELEAVFGAPTTDVGDDTGDKVTTEWMLKFSDGTVATVYDWKRYEEGAPRMNLRYDWHVGGRDGDAALMVNEYLRNQR
jgi:hypothetical protein